jgi:hypothetical protein
MVLVATTSELERWKRGELDAPHAELSAVPTSATD